MIESYLASPHTEVLQVAISPFFSPVHQVTITPTDITRLNHVHRAESLSVFSEYTEEIRSIASGVSLCSPRNIKLLKFVQHTYFACPNHGQMVEGGVKNTALARQTGAEEQRRNNIAIIRSHTVEETNMLARKKQIHKTEGQENHVPTGSKLTSCFLDVVQTQFERDISNAKIKTAKQLLSRTSQYKQERQSKKVDSILSARRKSLNKAQLKRGIDYTAAARGLIGFGTVYRSSYIPQVIAELQVRGVEIPEEADGIKKLLDLLKADEKQRHNLDAKAFKPLSNFSLEV